MLSLPPEQINNKLLWGKPMSFAYVSDLRGYSQWVPQEQQVSGLVPDSRHDFGPAHSGNRGPDQGGQPCPNQHQTIRGASRALARQCKKLI